MRLQDILNVAVTLMPAEAVASALVRGEVSFGLTGSVWAKDACYTLWLKLM